MNHPVVARALLASALLAAPAIASAQSWTPAQVAYWERAIASVDKDDAWRASLERYHWVTNFTNGRDTPKYWDDLSVQVRATLDDLGLLKQ